jgi:hypothetical protein
VSVLAVHFIQPPACSWDAGAIRRATPIIVMSLFVMICALGFSTVGNNKNDVKTFIGAVLYVLAGEGHGYLERTDT